MPNHPGLSNLQLTPYCTTTVASTTGNLLAFPHLARSNEDIPVDRPKQIARALGKPGELTVNSLTFLYPPPPLPLYPYTYKLFPAIMPLCPQQQLHRSAHRYFRAKEAASKTSEEMRLKNFS